MASERFEELRNSDSAKQAWSVLVFFPEFNGIPEATFKWSTIDDLELEDYTYNKKLSSIPQVRHQKDRGNDYAEFAIANKNNEMHNLLYPYQDNIEVAEITIRYALEIDKDFYESEIVFFGYAKDFNLDDSDFTIKFTANSDMSREKYLVGGRVLTRERCGALFNVNGVLPPNAKALCTWQTSQGGNPLFCSKFLNGVNSCAAHNNTHQFAAVTGKANALVTITPLRDNTQGGFDYSTQSPDRQAFIDYGYNNF